MFTGGADPKKGTQKYDFVQISEKLHEIEINLVIIRGVL